MTLAECVRVEQATAASGIFGELGPAHEPLLAREPFGSR